MLYRINIENEKDKLLIEEIVKLFLAGKNYEEIAQKINQEIMFVEWILNYKRMIINHFSEECWEKISIRKCELKKIEKEKRKEIENEQIVSNVIYYMLNSLYNYEEIAQRIFVRKDQITSALANKEYIKEKYGENILKRIEQSIELRKICQGPHLSDDLIIVKDPKHRSLIYSDIVTVTSYQYSLIEVAASFFEYNGNSEELVMNSEYHINSIYSYLNTPYLKDLLLECVYEKLQMLLEIDSILTQNRIKECKELIKKVVSITYYVAGDTEKLEESIGYPIEVIKRILNHPLVPIICKELGIDQSSIIIEEDKEKELIIK